MTIVDPDLVERAEAWLAEDPDPATAHELRDLLDRARQGDTAASAELADAFDGTLQFGTAGLRGRLGPGSNRMNRVVVARAAAGLAQYLCDTGGHAVVIGYDARRNSDVFAHDTAQIMAGAGISAMVLPHPLPTPLTAFAIRYLGASAGVMVTASHNPPDDNGYKVYVADGAQIIPPTDAAISARIEAVGPLAGIPRSDDYVTLDNSIIDAYVNQVEELLLPGPRDIITVYTPMHGVGGDVFIRSAMEAGFPRPRPVAAQFAPDGSFPTVRFPNPEEPGAMDLALAEAREHGADIIIANDPDADRCSAGIPTADGFRMLSGDETGWLLGWWTIERMRRRGLPMQGTLAQSIVSGTLLRDIAASAGLDYAITLTGFKWIARVPRLIFGYEQALGYCVDPEHVKDKDGISASLVMMELAAHLKAEGRSIDDVLAGLAREHGLYLTSELSVRVTDLSLISDAMIRLRAHPPSTLAGRTVIECVDLEQGAFGLPPTDGLLFTLDNARVIVRPSGTEPKIKCYLQVVIPDVHDIQAARTAANEEMTALRESLSQALAMG